jgi:hypothetical protein
MGPNRARTDGEWKGRSSGRHRVTSGCPMLLAGEGIVVINGWNRLVGGIPGCAWRVSSGSTEEQGGKQ